METSLSSHFFPLGGCHRARDVCDRRSWTQCCHFVRDQILPWAFDLALFYLRCPNSGDDGTLFTWGRGDQSKGLGHASGMPMWPGVPTRVDPSLMGGARIGPCHKPSRNYTCIIMSFNFKRHDNTYKILKRHNYVFKNGMTFLCHKFWKLCRSSYFLFDIIMNC